MGQSIHPLLLRLGFSRTWSYKVNEFKNFNYIDFFDNCKKIEKYLVLFFNKKSLKSLGFYYSHSIIKVGIRHVSVDVFIYQVIYDYLKQYLSLDYVSDQISTISSDDFFKNIGIEGDLQPENLVNKLKFYFRDGVFVNDFLKELLQGKFEEYLIRVMKKDFRGLNINLKIYNLSNGNITGSVVTQFIKYRLKRKYKMSEIIHSLLNDYFPKSNLEGLFIICKGRYTKQQRASNDVFKTGKLALSSIYNGSFLDYHMYPLKLKYGICAIKIISSFK